MTRTEIRRMFRTENPEITDRVITSALLNEWCVTGDKEICAITRCIVGSINFTPVADDQSWDLTQRESKFYDIDEYPGGGVAFNDDRLNKVTKAQLDQESSTWRTRSSGTPQSYYRRGGSIYFDRPIETAYEIDVDCVMISDNFNDDDITPYNQLTYLEPFHYGVVKYLQWKAKEKVGKDEEPTKSRDAFYEYAMWMKKEIGGGKLGPIQFRPRNRAG